MTPHIRIFIAVLLCWSILMYARPVFPSDTPISLAVSPLNSFEPATVRLTIRIPRHPDNRQVCVVITDVYESFYRRSSCWSVTGDSPITYTEDDIARSLFAVDPLEGDNYVATAILTRGRQRFESRQSFRVFESER